MSRSHDGTPERSDGQLASAEPETYAVVQEEDDVVIVVGYVPRPEGRAALERGVKEAQLRDAQLVVVNSSRGDAYLDSSFASNEDLDTVRGVLADSRVRHEVRQPVRGRDAADDVTSIAEETGAELIVIGMRRRTPVGKLLLGSDAQRILLDAACPVLAVKPGSADR